MRALAVLSAALLSLSVSARAVTLAAGDILAIGGVFQQPRDLYRIDPTSGAVSVLAPLPASAGRVVAESATTVLYTLRVNSTTTTINRLSLLDGTSQPLSTHTSAASFIPQLLDYDVGADGRIIAVETSGIYDVDPSTGAKSPRIPGTFGSIAVDPHGDVWGLHFAGDDNTADLIRIDVSAGTYSVLPDPFEGGNLQVDAAGNRYVFVGLADLLVNEGSLFRTSGSPAGFKRFLNHSNTDGQGADFAIDANGDLILVGVGFPEGEERDLLSDVARYDAETGAQSPIANLDSDFVALHSVDIFVPEPAAALLVGLGMAVLAAAGRR